jgi:hypothetical protein
MREINFDKQNERVLGWMQRTENSLKGNSNALGITHRANSPSNGSSVDKIKAKEKYRGGIIEVVSFKFPRSLIYTHKGAGKGRGGLLGSTWYDALGIKHTTNPNSFGKMGTGGRVAKEWFNNTIEAPAGVEELATIVAEESGDAIVNNLLIK